MKETIEILQQVRTDNIEHIEAHKLGCTMRPEQLEHLTTQNRRIRKAIKRIQCAIFFNVPLDEQ